MNNKVPSLKDSNSIVALSVSISARMSPSTTLSPTFFNQDATVPSVIVSLKRGIVTTITPFGNAVAAGAVVAAVSVSAFASAAGAGVASSAAGAFAPPLIKAETSSPSFPIIAKRESTGAVSPSGIPMYKSVPSLKDSNSIVALSVSISAKISPSLTLSPTFLSQAATVPSVIVSLKRGIVTIVAIIDL